MASKIRDKIVDHAIACFAEQGYSGCSTKSISTSANVTEGSLFRLFRSKEKLFEEALDRVRERKLPQKDFERLLNTGTIEHGIGRALGALHARQTVDAVRLAHFATLERADMTRRSLGATRDLRVKAITKRIRTGISRREVRANVDAPAAALAIYTSVRNIPLDSLFDGRTRKAQAVLVQKFIALWLHGILK